MRDFLDAFEQNSDGSWTCVAEVTLHSANGPIYLAPGNRFPRGAQVLGVEIARLLDEYAKSLAWSGD